MLQVQQTLQVIGRQGGGQPGQQGGRGGDQAAIIVGRAERGGQVQAAGGSGRDLVHGGGVADVDAQAAQVVGKLVGKGLEAAGVGAQAGGAGLDARPHPGHVDLAGVALAELADHQRLPHQLVDAVAGPFAHPGVDGVLLKRLPVVRQL